MTTTEIDYIKTHFKWAFSWWNFFSRYFIVTGPIAITSISFSMFYGGFKFGHIYKDNFMNSFFFTALGGLLLGVFFIYYTIRRINIENKFLLIELPKHISFDDIPEKILSTKWFVTTKKDEFIQVSTNITFFSWGELITIINNADNCILVNSRPIGRQPFTFNRDRVNFEKLKALLQ